MGTRPTSGGLLIVLLLAVLAGAGKGITDLNHADWRWRVVETDHFAIHYPTSERDSMGAQSAAMRIADQADALWLRMGDLLEWYPTESIRVVVVDHTDDLKAWAWPLRSTVVIGAHPAVELGRTRSRGDQLMDVFAHELAHVFTHKRASSHSELLGLGLEGWSHTERDGVAVGARIPAGMTVPQWWSEGAAEYLATRVGHGWWSAGRVAALRVALAEDRLLSWDELQVASDKGDTGDGELAYQQGHAFFRWLEEEIGEGTFARIHELAAERSRLDPASVLAELDGRHPRALYGAHLEDLEAELLLDREPVLGAELWPWAHDWESDSLRRRDQWQLQGRRQREKDREGSGSWNLHPSWSSDGRWLGEHRAGWVRVRRSSEGAWSALAPEEYPLGARERARALESVDGWIPGRFGSGYAFVPGRDAVVVSGPRPLLGADLDGFDTHQLYLVDLTPRQPRSKRQVARVDRLRGRTSAIPGTDRALDPAVSSDGGLAYVRFAEGRPQLVRARLDGGESAVVLELPAGSWIQSPTWSPDGSRIAVAVHHGHRSDLWVVDADGTVSALTADGLEEADPYWAEDGLYFVADVDGVHDVFRLDPRSGGVDRITRVTGSAATPSVTPEGHLLYAHRTGSGWKSMALRRDGFVSERALGFVTLPHGDPRLVTPPTPERTSRRYLAGRDMLPLAIAPELRVFADPAGSGVLAGGWLLARDPVEHLDLAVNALFGEDALVYGAVNTRVLPVDVGVWGGWEDDIRWLESGERRRVLLGAGGVSSVWSLVPGVFELRGEAMLRHLAIRELGPLARTWLGSAGMVFGNTRHRNVIGRRGGRLSLAGMHGRSGLEGTMGWWRVRVDGESVSAAGPTNLELAATFGASSPGIPAVDRLRAGGDAPSALRPSVFEEAISFPGFAPRSIAGENLAKLSGGLVLPIRDIRRRVGPVYLDDLALRVGGDVGNGWNAERPAVPMDPLLADVTGEIRLVAEVADQRWNSVVRVAQGFGQPAPTDDPTQARTGVGAPRLVIGIGTGW